MVPLTNPGVKGESPARNIESGSKGVKDY
jgi:hypothetical protein